MQDLNIKLDDGRFNYRVGAIIVRDNKILMVRNNKSPHYYSVGGRVRLGESSKEALSRELVEEIGQVLKIGDLAIVQESFFEYGVTKEKFHEVCFFYYVDYDETNPIEVTSFTENSELEYLEWLDMDKLNDYEIYPKFFKTEITKKHKMKHFTDKYY